ncbi:hypothetical protein GCM10022251_75370 [Phytohabitans flavus]|uniref:Uncharacterized protein n=1 Tax=Phytohabitans flavus TaxID=1076124 RepID=A0A6F8XMC9_9ACTN|nr:hypothetical protein Pflav_013800 [Phytohabitans flavus]
MGRSLAVTNPGEFRAEDWFGPRGLELSRLPGRACIEEMAGVPRASSTRRRRSTRSHRSSRTTRCRWPVARRPHRVARADHFIVLAAAASQVLTWGEEVL